MSDLSALSDAELMAAYKAAKAAPAASPLDAALAAEGINGPLADLARSIYTQESSDGKNTKTSNAGAVGGMQILPSTFAGVADKGWNINDPTQNARAGVRYLKQMYEQSSGDPAIAAAGYYGGPGGLEKARRGVAVSDPRNPNAPNTLQYGQQVAARLPQQKGLIQRGVEAVIPSANAAEQPKPVNPLEGMSDEELLAAYQKLKGAATQPAPAEPATSAPEGGGAAFGVYPKARRDARNNSTDALGSALKGVASGFADVGNTIINSGTKAAANAIPSQPNMLINPDLQRPQAGITNIVSGQMPMSPAERMNAERAQGLKDFNEDNKGAIFSGGRLIGNIAATYPIGGAIAAPIKAVAPAFSPAVASVLTKGANAIESGGMRVGGAAPATTAQAVGNGLLRFAGGAINGATTAGAINPDDAATGALYGMATPAVAMAAAPVGKAIGNRLAAKSAEEAAAFARKAPLTQTLKDAIAEGYVVTPSSVNPTLYNTVKESMAGKIATAQSASVRNQEVTDKLVRRALGLAEDAPLSTEALKAYRTAQVQAGYEPIRQLGTIKADPKFASDLSDVVKRYTGKGTIPAVQKTEINDLVRAHQSGGFDSSDAVDAIRILREDAADAFKKGDSALGNAQRALANAYEGAVERALPQGSDLLKNYQLARQNIAKSFSVEDALKEGTGAVDARKLATALQKDVPLEGDLLTVARFGSAFPKATQPPSIVAGAGVNNLKAYASSGGGVLGTVFGGPVGGAAMAAAPWVVPPALRAQMFSQRAQNALIPQAPSAGGNRLLQFAQRPEVQQLLYKAAPVAATQSP